MFTTFSQLFPPISGYRQFRSTATGKQTTNWTTWGTIIRSQSLRLKPFILLQRCDTWHVADHAWIILFLGPIKAVVKIFCHAGCFEKPWKSFFSWTASHQTHNTVACSQFKSVSLLWLHANLLHLCCAAVYGFIMVFCNVVSRVSSVLLLWELNFLPGEQLYVYPYISLWLCTTHSCSW